MPLNVSFPTPLHPLINDNHAWPKSDDDIPLPNHLSNVFKPHKNFLVPKYSYFVIDQLHIPLPVSLPSPLFHFKEHSHANSKLTNHAPIFDFFSPTILRHLPGKIVLVFTLIYNVCFRAAYFSPLRKYSAIKLIHKLNHSIHHRPNGLYLCSIIAFPIPFPLGIKSIASRSSLTWPKHLSEQILCKIKSFLS